MNNNYSKNKKKYWHLRTFGVLLVLFFFTTNITFGQNVAACIVKPPNNKNSKRTFLETKKALQLLSANINNGIENAQQIKQYNITKDKIFKQ